MIRFNSLISLFLLSIVCLLGVLSCRVNGNESYSAHFPGGREKLNDYLSSNMQWQQGHVTVEGKVYVSFLVTKEGSIQDIELVKGLSEECNKEAIRLVEGMPNWVAAKRNGKSIESKVTIPVTFKLYND